MLLLFLPHDAAAAESPCKTVVRIWGWFCWTLGTFIRLILTGTLVEQVGYYKMECVLGKSCCVTSGGKNWIAHNHCSGDLSGFVGLPHPVSSIIQLI